jgi:hypothetical protein
MAIGDHTPAWMITICYWLALPGEAEPRTGAWFRVSGIEDWRKDLHRGHFPRWQRNHHCTRHTMYAIESWHRGVGAAIITRVMRARELPAFGYRGSYGVLVVLV